MFYNHCRINMSLGKIINSTATKVVRNATKIAISKRCNSGKNKIVTNDNNKNNNDKINLYNDPYYLSCMKKAKEFEESDKGYYYKEHFCLKPMTRMSREDTIKKAYENIKPYINNSFEEIMKKNTGRLCVLGKGHKGSCSCSLNNIFVTNDVTKKLMSSIDLCINTTPGADDYVYKNRASRLFPIFLSAENERKIRNKNKKLRCAIPLREHTTSFMLATAYIDWLCYTVNINDIKNSNIINPKMKESFKDIYQFLICDHKDFINEYFKSKKRRVFDEDGNTLCAIKQIPIKLDNMADITRDNRIAIDDNDIQMGHICSRKDNKFTICGVNLVMMTREGNRIVGEDSFLEDIWINKLRHIISFYG
jgi:hypothetical protein